VIVLFHQTTDQFQYSQVCIGGQLSAPALVTIGVPQGLILGPLAFILFINVLPKSTLKFICADDTDIFFSSDNSDTCTIKGILNSDLDTINT